MDLSKISYEDLAAEIQRRRLLDAPLERLESELQARYDQLTDSATNTDPRPKFVDIQALLDDRPQVSPSVEIEIGGKAQKICFRELSREQIHWAETAAAGYVKKTNEEAELPYEHINSIECQERLAAEKELRIIHSTCVKPGLAGRGSAPAPAFDLAWLRHNLTPREQTDIMRRWEAWYTRDCWHEVDLDEDQIQEMIEAVKKNEISFWLGCSYGNLAQLLRFSVCQQAKFQNDSS